jgi:uncharacterized glyoxalase superfamily protein PhnB
MHLKHITPILNVSDVPASIEWFERLGWNRCWAWNSGGMIAGNQTSDAAGPATFAAVGCGEVEIFLCDGAQGSRGSLPTTPGDDSTGGVWMSWWLNTPTDVDELHNKAKSLGCTIGQAPTDEPWGVREFWLVHPDGHTFRVSAPLKCP